MELVGTCISWFFNLLQMKFSVCGYSISFFSVGVLTCIGAIAGLLLKGILTLFREVF